MAIRDKLRNIQVDLKAPKGQYNDFGNYKYRSCEDILEALKPLLKEQNCALVMSDEIVNIGTRFYVRAKAELLDLEDDTLVFNTAYAREDESKKGMDGSQITGTASSYARKYALNGLFCIDDAKDADTNEHAKETSTEKTERKATKKQIELLKKLVKDIDGMLEYYKVDKIEDLTMEQASNTISKLKEAKGWS